MVQSSIHSNVVIHRFKGTLDLRDILDARMFGNNALSEDPDNHGVLWDLSAVFFAQLDEFYKVLVNATVDANNQSSRKRGFLVGSARHRERVETVLNTASLPWTWRVFEDEAEAVEWLSATV